MGSAKNDFRSMLRVAWRGLAAGARRLDRWLAGGSSVRPRGADAEAYDWFHQHYGWAADVIGGFLEESGVRLEGASVADIGSGDGIIDLGLVHRWGPARLTGFDVRPTSPVLLAEAAAKAGVAFEPSDALAFEASGSAALPAADDAFDVVVSWSAFEHVEDPVALLGEVRRILQPDGWFFCQIRPLYLSRHGSHLERWFPEGWVHLQRTDAEIHAAMLERDPAGADIERMWAEFEALNRITIDGFGESLVETGFEVVSLELETERVELPAALARSVPLSALAIDGFRLLAR